ncbi:hypothetical protein RYX36_034144 [Vicia faba]
MVSAANAPTRHHHHHRSGTTPQTSSGNSTPDRPAPQPCTPSTSSGDRPATQRRSIRHRESMFVGIVNLLFEQDE